MTQLAKLTESPRALEEMKRKLDELRDEISKSATIDSKKLEQARDLQQKLFGVGQREGQGVSKR